MPLDLAAVTRGYGECVARWATQDADGNDTIIPIRLRYRADITVQSQMALQEAALGKLASDGQTRIMVWEPICDMLVGLLLPLEHPMGPGWDVTSGGEPVPITPETIAQLPLDLPFLLINTILADVRDPNRVRPSRAGSSPRASSPPTASPTTTDSSRTPNGPASLPGSSPDSATTLAVGSAGALG